MRIGFGYDAHRLIPGEGIVLGGVHIPCEYRFEAHSDGDVLVHALMDAMLGAACLGDIGQHFPDTDMRYKGIDSLLLLKEVCAYVKQAGYTVQNADITIVAQYPRLSPHIPSMQSQLASCMQQRLDTISIKATTEEHMGFTGRREGICAYSVCLLA